MGSYITNTKKKTTPHKRRIKCWEVLRCDETTCPAYKSRNLKCWLIKGTRCEKGIQKEFIDKIHICLKCKVFKLNFRSKKFKEILSLFHNETQKNIAIIEEREREIKNLSLELAITLSEVFEALNKMAKGEPHISISEYSDIEIISKLKHMINVTSKNFSEIIDLTHEIAIGVSEFFDVLHRVSSGNFEARVTGEYKLEILNGMKRLINEVLEFLVSEIEHAKASEIQIKKLEDLESSILNAIPHAVVGLKERRFIFANPSTEKVFGWKPNELLGKNTRILYRSDEEYEEIGRLFYPVLEKEKVHTENFPCRRKDGTDFLCRVTASVIGETLKDKGIVVVYEDITEQKKMEDALKESEKKYYDLYNKAPDGYQSCISDGTIVEVNDTWLKMLGYEREEVIGKKKINELIPEDEQIVFSKRFDELKTKGSIENLDINFIKKDGTLIPVTINATAIFDENKNFLRSRIIVRDNTEKKKYENLLLKSAEQWRKTFDSMPYGVLLLDKDQTIIRANKYVVKTFNSRYEDLIDKKLHSLIYRKDRPFDKCPASKACKSLKPETDIYYDEVIKKYFMLYAVPILDDTSKLSMCILSMVDITDLKTKEKKLTDSRDAFLNMLKELDLSYKELKELFTSFIHSFVNAIDAKSTWTRGHSERVMQYSLKIAEELGLSEQEIEDLRTSALLHDIGKIGTCDILLDKPDRLTDEEFKIVKAHPNKGVEILKPIKQIEKLLPVIKHHHERVDGKGYPDGLKGEEIPLLSRIIAVADSFDAMTSDRPYRPAPSKEYAMNELIRCKGSQYDPQIVEAFLRCIEKGKI